jgi:hypothetical protein
MGSIPAVLTQRWRSGLLVGEAKHQLVVRVRRAYINRLYQTLEMLDGSKPFLPIINGGMNLRPWQGQLVLEGPWITLPEIESAKSTTDTQTDNGSKTLTVVMDDIAFLDTEGGAGLYHTIARGYFSPQRGIRVAARPALWESNAWADVLNGGYQIECWEGYGPDGDASVIPLAEAGEDGTCVPPDAAISRTWLGWIDGCEIDSHPDQVTITARDSGILATDQRIIYRNKAPEIRSPITFADRKKVLGEKPAGYGAAASGTQAGYSPAGVLPGQTDDMGWVSDSQSAPGDMVWLELKLPAGSYDQFYLATEAPGQELYVAIDAVGACRWNGFAITPGWITTGNAIPGAGHDYVKHYKTVAAGGGRLNLGGELQCSEGTVLRVYLTALNANIYDSSGDQIAVPGYVADIFRMWGYRYGATADAPVPSATSVTSGVNAQGWVLIDDVADILRILFLWLGFKEWEVDDFGWSLDQPLNFGQDQFFTDVINAIIPQADFLFYMTAPSDDDMSIGVPCFKKQNAFTRSPPIVASVRDSDLLEALKVVWDLSNLPYSFRVRGAIDQKGMTFGQDLAKRFSGTYFPPWSGIDYVKVSPSKRGETNDRSERLAGLKRNYVSTQGQVVSLGLNSNAECMFAAVLTAVQYALGEAIATVQISGCPGIELNTGLVLIDEASGTNSRIWVSSIESNHTLGPTGSWHMTIIGSLLDTQDLALIAEDWAYVLFKYGLGKGAS